MARSFFPLIGKPPRSHVWKELRPAYFYLDDVGGDIGLFLAFEDSEKRHLLLTIGDALLLCYGDERESTGLQLDEHGYIRVFYEGDEDDPEDEEPATLSAPAGPLTAEECRAWRWRGTAGHFVGAPTCCFRLCTDVGGYRISTVGCYHCESDRNGPARRVGLDRMYETYVFRISGDEVQDWIEIDSKGYQTGEEAEAGHIELCRKWANAPAWTGPQPVVDGQITEEKDT